MAAVRKLVAVQVLMLTACLLTACDDTQPEQHPHPPQTTSPASASVPGPREWSADEAQSLLRLSALLLGSETPVISSTSGDLRPLWTASGRITNLSTSTVTSVRLKLIASERANGHDLDTAIVPIQQVIPPAATVSFRREVQLMLPSRGWAWMCLPDGATVKP